MVLLTISVEFKPKVRTTLLEPSDTDTLNGKSRISLCILGVSSSVKLLSQPCVVIAMRYESRTETSQKNYIMLSRDRRESSWGSNSIRIDYKPISSYERFAECYSWLWYFGKWSKVAMMKKWFHFLKKVKA